MESDRFDALTTRLAHGLTRRRGLGLLAALGAASLAADSTAGKHKKKKKKKKKPQPCGGACNSCQACVNGACAQLAEGTSCPGNGACFAGACRTCPSGKSSVDGLCATPCTSGADCATGICLKMANHNDANVDDPRKFCIVDDNQNGGTLAACPNGRSSDCANGHLCVVIATALRCGTPA